MPAGGRNDGRIHPRTDGWMISYLFREGNYWEVNWVMNLPNIAEATSKGLCDNKANMAVPAFVLVCYSYNPIYITNQSQLSFEKVYFFRHAQKNHSTCHVV